MDHRLENIAKDLVKTTMLSTYKYRYGAYLNPSGSEFSKFYISEGTRKVYLMLIKYIKKDAELKDILAGIIKIVGDVSYTWISPSSLVYSRVMDDLRIKFKYLMYKTIKSALN